MTSSRRHFFWLNLCLTICAWYNFETHRTLLAEEITRSNVCAKSMAKIKYSKMHDKS